MENPKHFRDMPTEREINPLGVNQAIADPERTEEHKNGTRHYLKRIPAFENRWLRVSASTKVQKNIRVTVFFDRRLRRMK